MIDIGDNVKLYMNKTSNIVTIKVKYNNKDQGIISIEDSELYIWYDEGKFPPSFETSPRNDHDINHTRKRLIITGVDLYD